MGACTRFDFKNWGGNDLVERCRGKMKLDEVGEFVSKLDKKDGILLGTQPTVQYDSGDDIYSDSDSDEDTVTLSDSGSEVDGIEADMDSSDPSGAVADAVAEVVVDGHLSSSLVEGGLLFTSNKTTQLTVSSLSGSDTDLEMDDL